MKLTLYFLCESQGVYTCLCVFVLFSISVLFIVLFYYDAALNTLQVYWIFFVVIIKIVYIYD